MMDCWNDGLLDYWVDGFQGDPLLLHVFIYSSVLSPLFQSPDVFLLRGEESQLREGTSAARSNAPNP